MSRTTFSGPVKSDNGFEGAITGNVVGNLTGTVSYGTSASPAAVTAAGNVNTGYVTSSATSGDTRLTYQRLDITSTGSGETLRAFTRVSGANAATAGTVNGAHISLSVNTGGTISGAANALRATLGVASGVTPGGTLSAIQVDSDFPNTVTLPGSAAFLRFTNSNTGTISNLMNVPNAMFVSQVAADSTHTIKVVSSTGVSYYLMCTNVAP